MGNRRGWLVAGFVFMLAGCSTATGSPAAVTTPPASAEISAIPSPIASTIASPTANPGEGQADPNGRIAFGRVVRTDQFYGPVVAIWVVDADGSDLKQLTKGESGFPAWSPDGKQIAFTMHQAGVSWQIATMAADGSGVKLLTSGFGADNAAWSPDGKWIAFAKGMTRLNDADFRTTIWRMDADGSHQKSLGDSDTFDVEPKISPDGKKLLFERLSFANGQQEQLLVIRTIATGAEQVLPVGTAVEHGDWSPDGKTIVYDISPQLGADVPSDQVESIGSNGASRNVLFKATDTSGGFKPSFSPDGTRIVFGCFQPTNPSESLCVMNADGSNVTVVVDDPKVNENMASWGVAAAP